MNGSGKKTGQNRSRAKVYTGNGFYAEDMKQNSGETKRRKDILREEEALKQQNAELEKMERQKRRAAALRKEDEKKREMAEKARRQEEKRLAEESRLKQQEDKKHQAEQAKQKKAREAEEARQKKVREAEEARQKKVREAEEVRQKKAREEEKVRQKKAHAEEMKRKKQEERRQEEALAAKHKAAVGHVVYSQELTDKLKARKKKKIRTALGIAGGIFAAAYIGAGIYFSSHFYRDTIVYGVDCSLKTADEVKAELADRLQYYEVTVEEREGKSEAVTAEQIGLKYEDDGSVRQMLKNQKAFIWPIMSLLKKTAVESVSFTYDSALAEERISSLDCMDQKRMVAPVDAYISPTDTGFEVVSEVMGTTLDQEKTREAICRAIDSGETQVSLEKEGCYIDPKLYQDDPQLQKDAAEMSELAGARIEMDLGDEVEVIDAARIQEWITKMANGSYVIDDMCVTEYVEGLAAKLDTFGMPIEFTTTPGNTVTLSGGDYGWCVDQEATVRELLSALAEGYRGEMEPEYLYTGMSHANNGIGYTYVEICISMQEMWCYRDGELIVDTPIVTGNPNKNNGTPSGGVWAIDAKMRNATLVGEDYRTPVDYWMPFNGNVGIHDLQSRGAFGGTIYLYAGSHGCVNTPYDAVQQIYETVSIGTPVIVYD